ncbi:MAG: hypothetical protein MUF43_07645, partial [Flavobacterium sp.]|nr:hypothetical protein [Flavobacterium sp.]
INCIFFIICIHCIHIFSPFQIYLFRIYPPNYLNNLITRLTLLNVPNLIKKTPTSLSKHDLTYGV